MISLRTIQTNEYLMKKRGALGFFFLGAPRSLTEHYLLNLGRIIVCYLKTPEKLGRYEKICFFAEMIKSNVI
jgi:hypothetical protein